MTRPALSAILFLTVAGCAANHTVYPSLAPRAVEKQGFAEPAAAVALAKPDAALDARIAGLAARLDAVAKGFATDAALAERRVGAAGGRAAGSEAWLEAQSALASLDDWRAQASAVATDVEQVAIERGATLAPTYPALTAISERANAEAARQSALIARLQAVLAPA